MIDKRPGRRIRENREALDLTQEQFAEKTGLTVNYIARVERGEAFPRLENLITIINALGVSADAVFCDVIDCSADYPVSALAKELDSLPYGRREQIMEVVRLLVRQANGEK